MEVEQTTDIVRYDYCCCIRFCYHVGLSCGTIKCRCLCKFLIVPVFQDHRACSIKKIAMFDHEEQT
jgi:hypothetical protein